MSEALRTPTGRPALSMTGATMKLLLVNSARASVSRASRWIDTGFSVMRSAAVSALSLNRGLSLCITSFMAWSFPNLGLIDRCFRGLPLGVGLGDRAQDVSAGHDADRAVRVIDDDHTMNVGVDHHPGNL